MKQTKNQAPTYESVWALMQENAQQMKESKAEWDLIMKESNAKFEREKEESRAQMAESRAKFDREMAESRTQMAESSAKFDHEMAESRTQMAESSAKFDHEMAKSRTDWEKAMAESNAKWEKRMEKLDEQIGGISKSNGDFAEEFFFNSFENGQQTFFGEEFDELKKNMKGAETNDEFDIVLVNGKSLGIVEVKYKGRLDNLPQVIKKAQTFRLNFPKYKNHQIYLALAAMVFNQRVEDECRRQGVAIIKQQGDSVVINDKHLKVY
jgi:hypothetical protein